MARGTSNRLRRLGILLTASLASSLVVGEAQALNHGNASNRVPTTRRVMPAAEPATSGSAADAGKAVRHSHKHRRS